MAEAAFDVTGIGNAIVDVLAEVDDGFLGAQGVAKGGMTLIDTDRAASLYAAMPPAVEASGGSAANTIAGLAALGARCGFIGRVRDDQLGRVFAHDIKSLGVAFNTPPATQGLATATCLVLVTPDAQRSMSTFLGASTELGPEDVEPDLIAQAQVTYLEGYLWDPPRAKEAMRRAIDLAHGAGRKVALSLSDAFCVDRYRLEFLQLLTGDVDILFANEAEILSLYQTTAFEEAAEHIAGTGVIAALTRSEKGSFVIQGGTRIAIPAAPPRALVDTTGAGDQYAAGFLYGLTRGRDLETCGRMGSLAASEVLDHVGPRPHASVIDLFRAQGLV